jgi:IS1 family transposase
MTSVLLPAQGNYREQPEPGECRSSANAGALCTQKPLPSGSGRLPDRRSGAGLRSAGVPDKLSLLPPVKCSRSNPALATGQQLWFNTPEDCQHSFTYSGYWQPYPGFLDLDCHEQCARQEGRTNHIERFRATLRNRLGRLTRKTLSFSKALDPLRDLLTVFICHYNVEIFREHNSRNR